MEFTGKEIQGTLVKPWTWGKLERLAPSLSTIYVLCKENDIDSFDKFLKNGKFMSLCMPEITKIISLTTEETEENIKDFPLDKVLVIVLTIFQQNLEYLKNLLSPFQEITKKLIEN